MYEMQMQHLEELMSVLGQISSVVMVIGAIICLVGIFRKSADMIKFGLTAVFGCAIAGGAQSFAETFAPVGHAAVSAAAEVWYFATGGWF